MDSISIYPSSSDRDYYWSVTSSDSVPDDKSESTTELGYPPGFNPVCPTCNYLNRQYGPDDGELIRHITITTSNTTTNF